MTLQVTGRVAGSVVVLMVVVAAGAPLTACGSSGDTPAGGKTIEVTPVAQTGTTVDAAVGDTVVVKLEANATTGYEWQFTAGDTFTIESSEYEPTPVASGVVGSGGTQVVTLKVTKAGSSDLTGVYVRPWETPSPEPAQQFQMTVVSK